MEHALLDRLTDLLGYRGPDDRGVWTDGALGFGHCLFRSTHYCRHEKQPLLHRDGALALVADARIDDRATLALHLAHAGIPTSTDASASSLIMAAYRAWSSRAPEHLLGDFAFVLWDRHRQRLFAARDRFGLRSLYYGRFPNGLILSNEILPILSHPLVSRDLNERALADFLLFGSHDALDGTQTPFKAIRHLGPAETLRCEDGQQHIEPYWTFPVPGSVLKYRREADYAEHFRHVFRQAVHDRIQAPSVVSTMSGGLDSTTGTALAAELMREGHGPEKLTALTAVSGPQDEEGHLAAAVAETLNIEHRTITAKRGKSLENWTSTPFPNANLSSSHIANFQFAASLGRVSLNAKSADYALCPEPFTIMAQWRAAGTLQTLKSLRTVRQRYGCTPPLGSGLQARLKGRPPPPNPITKPGVGNTFPPWFAPEFLAAHNLPERWRRYWEWWPDHPHGLRPTAHRMLLHGLSLFQQQAHWPLDYTPPDTADPFIDIRVIEFLWSLPPLPWFFRKHIIRSSMADRLPASVLQRRKVKAGKWLAETPRYAVPENWTPHPLLRAMIRQAAIPTPDQDTFRSSDLLPLLLDLWLTSLDRLPVTCVPKYRPSRLDAK